MNRPCRPVEMSPGGFLFPLKGGAPMNLDELKLALDRIPPKGAINKARRRAIIILINKLSEKEREEA